MTDTAKMKCIHASNLLGEAAFINGNTYEAHRENGKVFVKCEIGMDIQLQVRSGLDGKSVWAYEGENGTYHFAKI